MSTVAAPGSTVFITDYAWPDGEIERRVIEGAGFRLVAGPATPAPAPPRRRRAASARARFATVERTFPV
jgi:hypothetical protein